MRQAPQLIGMAPFEDAEQRIRPGHEEQLDVLGKVSAQLAQGVNRVRPTWSIDLEPACIEPCVPLDGETHHFVPELGRSHRRTVLHPWIARRHEDDAVEPESIGNLFGAGKMPHMNRVERTAHDAEAKRRVWIVEAQSIEPGRYAHGIPRTGCVCGKTGVHHDSLLSDLA